MYECHITFEAPPTIVELLQTSIEVLHWKFSKIDGDPVLGEGIKCYATEHFDPAFYSLEATISLMNEAGEFFQQFSGCKIIRKKVEQVLYDTKGVK